MQISTRSAHLVIVIAIAVAGCGGNSTKDLVAQLRNGDATERRAAVELLRQRRYDADIVIPALEQALQDSDESIRLATAMAIAQLDPKKESYRPELMAALEAGHASIYIEVGRLGTNGRWAGPTLNKLLQHAQPQIRALSARTLADIGAADPDVLRNLEKLRRDPNVAVQNAANRALDRLAASTTATTDRSE
jgi:HEAT repeat protein